MASAFFMNKISNGMKDKLTAIRINLITLLRKIEKLECAEKINYELIRKVDEINKKLGDVEALIQEIEANEEM